MITRCAIYTRKSSEEGLDMAFNSLDAQREAGADYIKSQKHQGWVEVETRYDDGGYSGGSTDRPGLQKLLADIQRGRVDVVLVYKVDRLSRSLTDFARLMQTFDEHKVSFVSVTQQFNTTTSMGRLTLNMLLSFAQFEREVAGERIRDKIAATKRKGVWVCGQPPLGYRLEGTGEQRGLRTVPQEADLVRAIYTGYLESGSLVRLAAALRAKGATTKRWQSSRGIWHGGKPLSSTFIYKTLTNPAYIGQIAHTRVGKTQLYPGLHEAIVDRELWDRVQARMAVVPKEGKRRWTHTHLLGGKIRTFEDHAMSPSSVWRPKSKSDPNGPKHVIRYYVSQKAIKQGYKTCPIRSVKAAVFDDLVRALVTHRLAEQGMSVGALDHPARDALVRAVLVTLTVAPDRLIAVLDFSTLPSTSEKTGGGPPPQGPSFPAAALPFIGAMPLEVERDEARETVTIRLDFKALAGRRIIRSADGLLRNAAAVKGESSTRATIAYFIGLAFLWHHELRTKGTTVESIAKRHGCSDSYVHRHLRLANLGPAILRDALSPRPATTMHLNGAFSLARTLCWRTQVQQQHRVGGPA